MCRETKSRTGVASFEDERTERGSLDSLATQINCLERDADVILEGFHAFGMFGESRVEEGVH